MEKLSVDIPLPSSVLVLSKIFSDNNATLFAVGGVVRDFLHSQFYKSTFSPKDVDLATELLPQQVIQLLEANNIKVFPKGESFGVISAIIDGEEFEIATFREDGDYSDGRRPDSVVFSSPEKDAKRRDFTFNALFYDINNKEVIDFNVDEKGYGMGLQDLKNLRVRTVGNPRDRFKEDKLRVLRFVRFFCRFHAGNILTIDLRTIEAINEFKDLSGVSPERIVAEFAAGLNKSARSYSYLKNCFFLGLFRTIFPGMLVSLHEIQKVQNSKNLKATLAWILKYNFDVKEQLNKLKYPNDISERVQFLINLHFHELNKISSLLKYRDLYKQIKDPALQILARDALFQDIQDFATISGKNFGIFLSYVSKVKSEDYKHLTGKAIGDAMNADQIRRYKEYFIDQNRK